MKLGREKLDNVEFMPQTNFLLVQKKIMLMDRFKSCPAVKKVLLLDRSNWKSSGIVASTYLPNYNAFRSLKR